MEHKNAVIAQLVRWEGNPRPKASADKRASLKASIADKGVILPLVVRPLAGASDQYEVIAGDTRRECVAELHAEGAWPADREIPIINRADLVGDDAGALDVALSENIHVPMHPMDQFTAFMQLVELGRDIGEIATAYGVSRRVVEQRLSYAKLDERARQLVKDGLRDLEWASAMTMASAEEQTAMLDEMAEDPRRYLTVHDVRRRLEDELVPTSLALFDVSDVAESLVRKDLFDEEGATYLTRAEFNSRQDEALKKLVEERQAEGWSRVSVVSEREFDRFRYYDGVQEKALGEVVFVRHASGAVVEHAGLALRVEERVNRVSAVDEAAGEALFGTNPEAEGFVVDRNAGSASEGAAAAPMRAAAKIVGLQDPLDVEGKKTARYLQVSRAMICQAALMSDPRLAIAVTVAGLLMPAVPKPVDGRMFSDIKEIDPANPARILVERRMDAAKQIMDAGGIDWTLGYNEVIEKLLALPDDQLMTLLQTEIASRVTSDLARGEMLYQAVMVQDGVTLSNLWRPDRSYLETLSKTALEALAKRILPGRLQHRITGNKSDIVEAIAQIVENAHSGEGMELQRHELEKLTAWAPASLRGEAAADENEMFGEDEAGDALFAESEEFDEAA